MNNLIHELTPLLIAWYVSNFEPGQTSLDYIYNYIPNWFKFTREYFKCFKCLSFWITLFITFNPIKSIAFSMLAYIYTRWINSLKLYI